MRRIRVLAIGVVILLLTGAILGTACTGTQDVKVVYCIGDSLTYGYPVQNAYEDELGACLGTHRTVVNKGHGGNTTSQMLDRFDDDVLAYDPDVVIIWGGINDVAGVGSTAAHVESNLQAMYSKAHEAGVRVIAVSISPFKGASVWSEAKQAVLDEVNNWIASTARDVDDRIDVYSELEDPANSDTLLPAYDSGDHVHLALAGYQLVGDTIYKGATWRQ